MNELFAKIIYIFQAATILTISLAVIGVYAFYLAISTWKKLSIQTPDTTELKDCARKISVLKVLAFSAPMLGLLGTVIGIAQCVVSVDNAQSLTDGISYALLTTQTGLILSIPAWIVAILLAKKLKEKKLSLAKEGK